MAQALADRFWAKVDRMPECRVWTGARHPKGYGRFRVDGRLQVAQRVAWMLAHGSEPAGTLRRTCATQACVRPDHYRLRKPAAGAQRRRQARGAGHIRQRSPGTWTVEVFAGTDPLDRRRRLREAFTEQGTFEDAQAAAEDYRARARAGDRINLAAKGTFGELLDLWLEHARLAPSTRRTYEGYVTNHVNDRYVEHDHHDNNHDPATSQPGGLSNLDRPPDRYLALGACGGSPERRERSAKRRAQRAAPPRGAGPEHRARRDQQRP
jgi:hypothetical protein